MQNLKTALAVILAALLFACSSSNNKPSLGQEQIADDEDKIAAKMIDEIKIASLKKYPADAIKRFNQSKSIACLNGTFHVPYIQSKALRQGVFAKPGGYPAYLRLANASVEDDREKDFHGLSIKVFNVGGQSLLGEDGGENGVQHFLLNSYPALFAGTPSVFLDFIEASRDGAPWRFAIKPRNWPALLILFKGREKIANPLAIRYWSTTPYRFGDDKTLAVKYSTQACSPVPGEIPKSPHKNYLRDAIARQIDDGGEACIDFMVQFQKNPIKMPIEDASVIWDEAEAPFQKLAYIIIKAQDFASPQALAQCEKQTFNPWQSLPAHQPLGGINRVRKAVYRQIADFRSEHNRNNKLTTVQNI